MGRPIFSYELEDPDFCWLVSKFQETNQDYAYVENGPLPVVFIQGRLSMEVPVGLLSGTDDDSEKLKHQTK